MMNELEEEQEGRGGEEEQGATREGWSGQNVVQGILSVCKKQDVSQHHLCSSLLEA